MDPIARKRDTMMEVTRLGLESVADSDIDKFAQYCGLLAQSNPGASDRYGFLAAFTDGLQTFFTSLPPNLAEYARVALGAWPGSPGGPLGADFVQLMNSVFEGRFRLSHAGPSGGSDLVGKAASAGLDEIGLVVQMQFRFMYFLLDRLDEAGAGGSRSVMREVARSFSS
ncbi:hypothetical protein HC251_00560 [Iamia sp. SCSIO 61187]|uniref:hypothetical protein n=1 Tax=Iamia sp. SCSIO 61187 TaxID=2722752 RepID=UPI001C639C1F|nr:hypothetical protein [Iamia sp. SCSIO 61187]QYG91072.1 hypothetical protein HC251_00560 [Iamia sp. SCSIO 61187]